MDVCDPDKIPTIGINLKSANSSARNVVIVTTGNTGKVRYWLLSKINVFLFSFHHKTLPVPKSHFLVHQFRGVTCLTVHLEPNLFQIMSLFMENVYDYLSREELIDKILAIQTSVDPYLNTYLIPKSSVRVVKPPEVRCVIPVEKSMWTNVEIELSSIAGMISEPSSIDDEQSTSSHINPISEPSTLEVSTSVLRTIDEPTSLLNPASSSVIDSVSEPNTVNATSSCLTAISEPPYSSGSSFLPEISEPHSIASSASTAKTPGRRRRRVSRASTASSQCVDFGFIPEPSTDESEVSEVFRTAKEIRYEVIHMSESCSVSSSFASRRDRGERWSSSADMVVPELELSEQDKEYLSEASEKSVDEAVENFYGGKKSGKSGAKKRRTSKTCDVIPPSLDQYFPNA